jgi:hypothetical protein
MATHTHTPLDPPQAVVAACPVAETMRRVHEQLRAGRAPSFEAMLAYGVPAPSSG